MADYAIYCIGDSLTAADYYEAELRTLLGGSYTVVNKGINGDTTSGMLTRFTTDVLNHDPDFSVIWGGVNDINRGTPLATIQSNLQSTYTRAHNAGITVIAIAMSPWKDHLKWTTFKQTATNDLRTWIKTTAVNIDYVIDIYPLLAKSGDPDALAPAYDSDDHLHFNSTAGVVIGQAIYDAVFAMSAEPSNLAPTRGAISASRTLTLQSSDFSSSYVGETHVASQWQITKLAGDYSNPVFGSGIDTSHLTSIVATLPGDSTYYWHVRYQSSDGTWSIWSSETSFVISSPPSQPTGVSPSGSASRVTLTPTLMASAFSDPGEGDCHAASQWQLRRTSGSYSSPIYDTGTDTTNLTAKTISRGVLSHSTAYYWHVRYQDSTGAWSDWSTETSFKTSAKGGLPSWIWVVVGAVAAVLGVGAVAYSLSRKRPPKRLQRRHTRSLKYMEDWGE